MSVTALLGPTNTGKTYWAIERLLTHRSGMVGFPLRLLARENYEKVVQARGADSVALVTGEERILPERPSFYICTVEAMPLDRAVDFLAVDEIQLGADRERGHVFTERLLHARGKSETMFMGAETVRPLLKRLVPDAVCLTRPRLSRLSYSPPKKLAHLPRRTAVIVFSVAELYAIAERLRRETGGAALVFGALSPRTRNAQVGLYQAGEVDYLVATDAIGMGLNLDIDHVVFSSLTKHDGRGPRRLRPAEVAQIAGRAGRHVRDGTFSALAELGPLDDELVRAVEDHRFDPLDTLYWRNYELSFSSVRALVASIEAPPPRRELLRMRQADDHQVLLALTKDTEVMRLARGADRVRLLWDACQIPDYRNVMSEAHARLVAQVFLHLCAPARRLPEDWVAAQVRALDRTDGDVETLLMRISGIRTWTYVAHRAGWVNDPAAWQARTLEVEDRLSDALHERLTAQFVDRRGVVIARYGSEGLSAEIGRAGEVLIQGLLAGRLEGFRFTPEPRLAQDARNLLAAANRALREGMDERVRALVDEGAEAFTLSSEGRIAWRGAVIGRLVKGESKLTPRVDLLPSDLLSPPQRESVRRRLAQWVEGFLAGQLSPLFGLRQAPLGGVARGVAFALAEGLGALPRRALNEQIAPLAPAERRCLARLGVQIGRWTVALAGLNEVATLRLRALLWALWSERPDVPLPDGRACMAIDPRLPRDYYPACGYHQVGRSAWRIDRLEKLLAAAYGRERRGSLQLDDELLGMAGGTESALVELLAAMGFARGEDGAFVRRQRQGRAR